MKKLIYLLTLLLLVSCHQEENTDVKIDVSLQTNENLTTPLVVEVGNRTQYAEEYLWTFEGGEPSSSTQKDPGKITFVSPGEHKITLEAWNQTSRSSKTYTLRVDSLVTADFAVDTIINNFAPAQFTITNLSVGGTTYKWIFDGGEPSLYDGATPPIVTYNSSGKYIITLIANNGSNLVTVSKEVEVMEALDASFTILPSFEDADDMEAPLRATFDVHLQGVETLKWECEGATFIDPTSTDATMIIPTAGTHTVYLEVSNGKKTKRVSQQIVVKENTNIRTHRNVKLGINTAQETIGCFYSTRLRRGFKSSEINDTNGSSIDIAFMGLNPTFTYNKFVSPDKLHETALPDIPGAVATKFINRTELAWIQLTPSQFESMITDELIKNIPITDFNNGSEHFGDNPIPRVVLFQTSDGRKGAILVKELVQKGREDSYIVVDIKVQKND